MIKKDEAIRYLARAKEFKGSATLYDMHVHPSEVIFGECRYKQDSTTQGLYKTADYEFVSPRIEDAIVGRHPQERNIFKLITKPETIRANLLKLYSSTGSRVFNMHMELSGVDELLLLPVAPPSGEIDTQMLNMEEMFGNYERFSFGWSIPTSVQNEDILKSVTTALERFHIKAVKLNPSTTGIDLRSTNGKERLECILESCNESKLPVVIHGGRSPLAQNPDASTYCLISNLMEIDWSISNSPVVIAHAGAYACKYQETEEEVIPSLQKMISHHSNLMIDISGLNVRNLCLVLKNISHDRILFGSDALYEPQWLVVVKLLLALEETTEYLDKPFITITSINPRRFIFQNAN